MCKWCKHLAICGLLLFIGSCTSTNDKSSNTTTKGKPSTIEKPTPNSVTHFDYGKKATPFMIAGWDIDVRPDGKGLPVGQGTAEQGEEVYVAQCAMCHGDFGEGVNRWPVLAGGHGSLEEEHPEKTIGSYWPYTSTIFDYIYRAMPYFAPQSLTPDQVYSITAYLLYLNEVIEYDFEVNQNNLAQIQLPNRDNFYPTTGSYLQDPRNEDVKNTRCMKNCVDSVAVIESLRGVTPEVAGKE